jgi:quercetin dioxygenase-like cupin family protein
MITVLDINALDAADESGAEVVRFLNRQTVGALRVEGTAYRLRPGTSAGPFREAGSYQLFYVTSGQPVAVYGGEQHRLGPGAGVHCDPGEPCAFENPSAEGAAFYRFVVSA